MTIPRRLRRTNDRLRYVLEVDPAIHLTDEMAHRLRTQFTDALRSGRPLITSGVTVRQLTPGMKWRKA